MSQEEKHVHSVPERKDEDDYFSRKCSSCGKSCEDMFDDLEDIDPTTKVSQQPYGKSTLYCNSCQMYVKPCSYDGEDQLCPYHQRTSRSEDGELDFFYDEFDEDGER